MMNQRGRVANQAMPTRRCLTCGTLCSGSYCDQHRRTFGRQWRTQTAPVREAARGNPCPECGEPMTKVSMHHSTPVARGGAASRLEPMCIPCNSKKGS